VTVSSFTERAGGAVRKVIPGGGRRANGQPGGKSAGSKQGAFGSTPHDTAVVDLKRRRDQLSARVAELQWDLGGLVYEMAIRDSIRVDVLVRRAATLQGVDAELAEVERILRLEQNSTAGECGSCGAPHSVGAAYCWQCGQPLMLQVPSDAIAVAGNRPR
jgi:chorismate mutase